MRNPNNKAIALLLIMNLLVCIVILYNVNKPTTKGNVAYADTLDDTEQTQDAPKKVKEEILFSIKSVTKDDEVGTIPLFFSHSNNEGAYFTYLETEQPNSWDGGYWYIDYDTLELANIESNLLMHNDVIQGVFYTNNGGHDHFEIKEAIVLSNRYSK